MGEEKGLKIVGIFFIEERERDYIVLHVFGNRVLGKYVVFEEDGIF